MPDDLDALGAQYREARDAIGPHRQRYAATEVAFAKVLTRHGGDRSALAVVDAQAAVDKARADVEWCKAAMVAAGEAIKGEPFEAVLARNEANRAQVQVRHRGLLAKLEEDV